MGFKPIDIVKYNLPGAILSVSSAGKPIEHHCAGYADLENGIPLSPDHFFQAGKVTRNFTAILILKLVEEGLVKLDQPLDVLANEHHLDGGRLRLIVNLYSFLKPLTLRELLNHTSGLPSYDETIRYQRTFIQKPKKIWQAEGYLDLITGRHVRNRLGYEAPVRGVFSDSATNYILVGLVLEAVVGRRSSLQMRELFDEYGLKHSFYASHGVLDEMISPKLAHGYLPISHPFGEAFRDLPVLTYNDNRELKAYDVTGAYTTTGLAGTAAMSNTTDLIHWMKLLLNKKIINNTFQDMFAMVPMDPRATAKEDRDYYGLGIGKTLSLRYGEIIWCAGNNFGYGILVAHSMERNVTFALAVNLSRQNLDMRTHSIVNEVLEVLLK